MSSTRENILKVIRKHISPESLPHAHIIIQLHDDIEVDENDFAKALQSFLNLDFGYALKSMKNKSKCVILNNIPRNVVGFYLLKKNIKLVISTTADKGMFISIGYKSEDVAGSIVSCCNQPLDKGNPFDFRLFNLGEVIIDDSLNLKRINDFAVRNLLVGHSKGRPGVNCQFVAKNNKAIRIRSGLVINQFLLESEHVFVLTSFWMTKTYIYDADGFSHNFPILNSANNKVALTGFLWGNKIEY